MAESPARFWKWFEKNHKAYLSVNVADATTKDRMLNDLLDQLHKYCDRIWFEIGGHPSQTQELIITCEGNSSYFEQVEVLVESAPSIPNWSFIAFIPAREMEFEMTYEDVTLKPGEMWFEPLENESVPGAVGIRVCTKNYELVKGSQWLEPAVYKILDTLLGEKSFALDIQFVQVDELPEEPEEEGLIELLQLRNFVIWTKSKSADSVENKP
jgi:hypothetical protein